MRYIHSKGMIYRDLNTEIVMFNAVFQVKLIDFGLAKINEHLLCDEAITSYSLTKGVGLDDFMSPEMMMQEDYDNKTDVYSFGIVMCYIFVGRIPKQNITEKAKGKKNKITKRIRINFEKLHRSHFKMFIF